MELPNFEVAAVIPGQDRSAEIIGRYTSVLGARRERGWLLRRDGPSIICDRRELVPSTESRCTLWTPDGGFAADLRTGERYCWLDAIWNPYHVDMILQPIEAWQLKRFEPASAQYFRQSGVVGWQKSGPAIPDGALDLGVREGAWDHEHCEICRATIGFGGHTQGYVDADDRWLCEPCYVRYARTHSLAWMLEA
jgi:hypothetical protein